MGRLLDDTYLKPFEAANRGKGMKLVMRGRRGDSSTRISRRL